MALCDKTPNVDLGYSVTSCRHRKGNGMYIIPQTTSQPNTNHYMACSFADLALPPICFIQK